MHNLCALVRTHREQALQRVQYWLLLARSQQIRKVAHRDPQALDVGNDPVHAHVTSLCGRLDRRQWRDVPDHGQRPVFRMQRERDLPLDRHLVDGRLACGLKPGLRNPLAPRLLNHRRVVRIQEQIELALVEILLTGDRRCCLDTIGVIEQDAQVADTANAGLRTNRRLTGLDPRVAERTLFRLAALPVVVDFLVGATRHAHPPTAALVLIDQNDAIVFALVDRAGGATRHARRVQAMLAQPGQVHHEGALERRVHLFLHALKERVATARCELAAEIVFPVRAPHDLVHLLAGDHGNRPGSRRGL